MVSSILLYFILVIFYIMVGFGVSSVVETLLCDYSWYRKQFRIISLLLCPIIFPLLFLFAICFMFYTVGSWALGKDD
jgi:hypothetical protein